MGGGAIYKGFDNGGDGCEFLAVCAVSDYGLLGAAALDSGFYLALGYYPQREHTNGLDGLGRFRRQHYDVARLGMLC